ncbi:hypothetical protein EPUS_08640 [Endocarpon pusillum Z07020]|uniref:Chromo domain-containing protein n=1 Tax=Endocarpon pusillum (strain Z07020 / HMAS-L-300199) TaxID=1263415 RepID=U1GBF3_ENDPU|nr:uncharacterized protein EPUS_08640 [Endocarpon pusillum Z07020]ERF69368.1 hypothetical protein EPUS_08640 [Endocarpon pusillum Z07020]
MAITRRQNIAQHSRRLRSRAVFLAQPAERAAQQPHQKYRQRAGRLYLPAHPAHVDHGVNRIRAPMIDPPRGSSLDGNGLPTGCAERTRTGAEEASPDLSNGKGGPSLQNGYTSSHPLSPQPDLAHAGALEMAGAETGSLGDAIPHETTSQLTITPNIETVVQNLDYVGVPQDGKWEHVAAHESRFCFHHAEEEWLLQTVDRWMLPSDFNIIGAETTLEAKLQKYESRRRNEKIHHAPRADCDGDFWSHVDTPIQRGESDGKVVYLIRWKFCWTRHSDIDDMSWVRSSFQEQNERINRRRSARVEDTAPKRMAKMKEMIVVVNIEDWL